jgi:RecA/RadA recombinase
LGEEMANIASAQLSNDLRNRFDLPVGFRERQTRQPFASGIAAVDRLLGGGFPRAALSEVSGAPSTNRTSLVVSTLARAAAASECAAWIDGAGTFDPESAAEAGLQLEQLLWINCRGQAEAALKAADLLLHGGGFGLMVFDLADIPEASVRRISMASWFRLRHAAEETGTALIALTPTCQTRSCAAVCIELTRQKSMWRGKLLRGIASLLEIRKHAGLKNAPLESVL